MSARFDNATQMAVLSYKKQYGFHQSYRSADGSWAVNQFFDPQTLSHMMAHPKSMTPRFFFNSRTPTVFMCHMASRKGHNVNLACQSTQALNTRSDGPTCASKVHP